MRVLDLLQAMPGLGKVRARQMMERLGISESRRVRGLGSNQIAALQRGQLLFQLCRDGVDQLDFPLQIGVLGIPGNGVGAE